MFPFAETLFEETSLFKPENFGCSYDYLTLPIYYLAQKPGRVRTHQKGTHSRKEEVRCFQVVRGGFTYNLDNVKIWR